MQREILVDDDAARHLEAELLLCAEDLPTQRARESQAHRGFYLTRSAEWGLLTRLCF
jgi:hypothetical protein